MATKKKASPSDQVILSISRTEATELLATLQQAERLVNVVKPQQTQNFLGGLIKSKKQSGSALSRFWARLQLSPRGRRGEFDRPAAVAGRPGPAARAAAARFAESGFGGGGARTF